MEVKGARRSTREDGSTTGEVGGAPERMDPA